MAHEVTIGIGDIHLLDDKDHIVDPLTRYLLTARSLAPGARHCLVRRMELANIEKALRTRNVHVGGLRR